MGFWRALTLLLTALFAAQATPARSASSETLIAFTHVNVVPMDSDRVLLDQTVVVRDGVIVSVGRASPLAGARLIDGRGAWLSPGLADMHNHVETRHDLALLLAMGITTSLNLGEADNSFVGRTRAAVERGDIPGPRVFVALAVDGSPQYGHLVVATPEDAAATVRVAKVNGYEFIKVTTISPRKFTSP